MFTDFVYLLLFLLSLYGFVIPLFQNSRMAGPGGFVSGCFVYNHPQAIYYQHSVCLSRSFLYVCFFFGSDRNVLAIQNVKWTIFAVSSHVFFNLGVS